MPQHSFVTSSRKSWRVRARPPDPKSNSGPGGNTCVLHPFLSIILPICDQFVDKQERNASNLKSTLGTHRTLAKHLHLALPTSGVAR
jgi:hypothetical protein